MTERRKRPRAGKHPLEHHAKLRTSGPALERRTSPRKASPDKERLTVQLGAEILNRLRNAVFWTPGLTMTRLIEHCIIHAVDGMERKRGRAFPQRFDQLKAGRPPR